MSAQVGDYNTVAMPTGTSVTAQTSSHRVTYGASRTRPARSSSTGLRLELSTDVMPADIRIGIQSVMYVCGIELVVLDRITLFLLVQCSYIHLECSESSTSS